MLIPDEAVLVEICSGVEPEEELLLTADPGASIAIYIGLQCPLLPLLMA